MLVYVVYLSIENIEVENCWEFEVYLGYIMSGKLGCFGRFVFKIK